METVWLKAPVLWAQLDVNGHLRHSAYADFAAQARVALLNFKGLTIPEMTRLKIGPVLFREELTYRREVRANDEVCVTCRLRRARKDGSRWSFEQKIYRSDEVLAATIIADGAWIDTEKRKLTPLPEEAADLFNGLDKTPDFEWLSLTPGPSPSERDDRIRKG